MDERKKQNTLLKLILLDTFFMILYLFHLPRIINGGSLFNIEPIIDTNSISRFFKSYIGLFLYLFFTFYLLHNYLITYLRK